MKKVKQLLISSMICFFLLCSLIIINLHQNSRTEQEINQLETIVACSLADSADDWWSHFGHDSANTRTSNAPAITTDAARIIWSSQYPTPTSSSVIITDQRIYVGTQYSLGPNNVYCFDAVDGTLLWSNSTSSSNIYDQPAVFDGKLFIGADDKCVYCFDALTGRQIWKTNQLAGMIRGGITVVDGQVFLSTALSGQVYCLNATTGDILWNSIFHDTYGMVPAVVNNHVYFTSNEGTLACYDTNPQNQSITPLWSKQIEVADEPLGSSPTVVDNRLFIGSPDKKLYCFNANTGETLWRFTSGDKIFSSPAVYNNKVYFSSNDGLLYCLAVNDGTLLWKTTLSDGAYPKSPSLVTEGKLYVTTAINYEVDISPRIYCFDALTGDENWFYSFNSFSTAFEISDPIIGADGRLFITLNNTIFCLGPNNKPGKPDMPTGQILGKKLREYEYSVAPVIDPDADQVLYQWDFGDGSTSLWITTPTSNHIWSTIGSYQVKVKAKDNHGVESTWSDALTVTIATEIQNELTATLSTLSILEGNEFTISVMLNTQPIQGAVVKFLGTSKTTDSFGVVSFIAPAVSQDRSYPISVSYTTYDSVILTISILNQKTTPNGWIYGQVYDVESGKVLADAQIGIILSEDSIRYVTTDTEGVFVFSARPGTYSLIVNKDGYEQTIITEIIILENIAGEQNIGLFIKQNPTTEDADTRELVDYLIKDEEIGARVDVQLDKNPIISYYTDDLIISMDSVQQTVSFTIGAEEGTPMKIIAIRIGDDVLPDRKNIKFCFDGIQLLHYQDIASFFDLTSSNEPAWIMLSTDTDTYVFFRTHFSEHSIVISSIIEGLSDIVGLFLYAGFFITAGVLFFVPVVVSLRRLTRMKKEE